MWDRARRRPMRPEATEPSRPQPALPPSPTPPGTYTVERRFFDDYPRFLDTSETATEPDRLSLRYEAIFGQNAEHLRDARVLDIASHDGRWSHAALATGASHVLGVEGRSELVESARANLAAYGWGEDRYDFVAGDIFETLAAGDIEVDVVLCLGFFYHTLRHNELWAGMRRTGARVVIMDTTIHPDNREPVIRVGRETVHRQRNAIADEMSHEDTVLTGRPSMKAMRMLGAVHGYRLDARSDWAGLLRDNPEVRNVVAYREGRRKTVRFVRSDDS